MAISSLLAHILHLAAYHYSGCAVLIVLIMEEEEEMVERKFNTLGAGIFSLSRWCEKYIANYINS